MNGTDEPARTTRRPHLAFSVRQGALWQDVCDCPEGEAHPLRGGPLSTPPVPPLDLGGYTLELHQYDGTASLSCTTCCLDVPVYEGGGTDIAAEMDLASLVYAAQAHEQYRHRFGREAHAAAPTGRAG